MAKRHGYGRSAKGRYYRKGGGSRFQAIPFNAQTALQALSDTDIVTTNLTALAQDAYLHSMDVSISLRDGTAGEGPLTFGIASDSLTDDQVEEALDTSVTSESDVVSKERASRPVRRIGRALDGTGLTTIWNDGRMKRVKIKMMLAVAQNLHGWVRNQSGATLTTGAIVEWQGTIYLNWR